MKKIEFGLSDISVDLLRLIFERLCLVDLVRAGAVSKTLHDVSKLCLPYVLGKPRAPWLMSIPDSSSDAGVYMMNLEENKRSYCIRGLKELHDSWIAGCSNGWLVLFDVKANPRLFNPFTRTRIKLPPIEELKSTYRVRERADIGDDIRYRTEMSWEEFQLTVATSEIEQVIEQAIVTVDDGNKVNGVFVRACSSILYWRRGENHWNSVNRGRRRPTPKPWYIMFDDNKLHVLTQLWSVEIWDCSSGAPKMEREMVNHWCCPQLLSRDMTIHNKYMVKVGPKEFLVVVKIIRRLWNMNFLLSVEETESWELYRINDESQAEGQRIQALDGYAVFVGRNVPVVLPAEHLTGCRGNTIYYSHDLRTYDRSKEGDVGIFDLQTKTFDNNVGCKRTSRSVWIVPNLSE